MSLKTKKITIKNITIGGGSPIAIQSMTDTKTWDIDATVAQISRLESAGCDIVRLAVPDSISAKSLAEIKRQTNLPLVADIHFDYKLAIQSVQNGADKLRFNPGNIGSVQNLNYLIDVAKEYNVPIRIGVNSGSIEKEIKDKHTDKPTQLVKSALKHVNLLQERNFDNIVISVKSSTVTDTIRAYRLLSSECGYPLHLGVTEAGTAEMGEIKSAIGIGALLVDGIGDTIRVSLTGDPAAEIHAAQKILKSINLMPYAEVISCPTCGRCNVDIKKLADEVNQLVKDINIPLKIAVMGCVVNGVGEAEDADLGVAGGSGKAVIFKKGKPIKTVNSDELISEFKRELDIIING